MNSNVIIGLIVSVGVAAIIGYVIYQIYTTDKNNPTGQIFQQFGNFGDVAYPVNKAPACTGCGCR
uniref:Uncharacterized protein n=1 Tax=viral metagenome TaxID=1070528 RepID=A0A6C0JWV4_9ZZZZ